MRFQFYATAMIPLRKSRAQFRYVSRRKGANSRMTSRLIAALNAAWRSVRRAQPIGSPLLTQAEQTAGAGKAQSGTFWDQKRRHCAPFAHWESPAPIQHARTSSSPAIFHPSAGLVHVAHGPFAHVAELGCSDGFWFTSLPAILA